MTLLLLAGISTAMYRLCESFPVWDKAATCDSSVMSS